MTGDNWIKVREARDLYDARMNLDVFRRILCAPDGDLARRGALRVRTGPKGKRIISVLESGIKAQIADECSRPPLPVKARATQDAAKAG